MSTITKYGATQLIRVDEIRESPRQIRKDYGNIDALTEDIGRNGILQSITVRPIRETLLVKYELVFGHRRLRAVKKLGWLTIPAVVKAMSDEESDRVRAAENIQHKSLSPLEMAKTFSDYMKRYGVSQWKVAKALSVSSDTVSDYLSILLVPEDIQEKIHKGEISLGKVTELARLTRKPVGKSREGQFQTTARTDEYLPAIRKIAEDTDLDREGVSKAVSKVQAGQEPETAIREARIERMSERMRGQIARGGRTPEEIAAQLKARVTDGNEIMEVSKRHYREMVRNLVSSGLLTCPKGENGGKLIWSCCGEEL